MNDLWDYLKTSDKPIVLYGMGNGADKIISVLESKGIKFSGVFATDEFVREKYFHGFKLSKYSDLKEQLGQMIVLLCFGSAREEVIANVKRIASDNELFAPDVPVYGKTLFDKNYYEQNKSAFEKIKNLLADTQSVKTFEDIVKYKISGDITYLFDCETEPNEPYNTFFKLSDKETFFDLGAYRGDTALDFVSRVNDYSSILCVEPDSKTYKKMLENIKHLKNIYSVNACVTDICGKVPFEKSGSRGSFAGKGEVLTDSVNIDFLSQNYCKPTYIKFDIEGSELSALKGACNTIKQYKPKMLVSCYHRSEDILTLPQQVLNIRDDYKIYMRHFKSLPAWDTCYYFV